VETIDAERSTRLKRGQILGLAAVSIEMEQVGKFQDADANDVVIHLVYAISVTTDNSIELRRGEFVQDANVPELNPRLDDANSIAAQNTSFRRLAKALALIAPKLPKENEDSMRKVVQRIRLSLQSTNDPAVMHWLAQGLTAMAESKRMTEQETREALGQILTRMSDPASGLALPSLTNAAASMVRSFDLSQLMYSLDRALTALDSDLDPQLLGFFLSGIGKLAALVDPKDIDKAKNRIIAVTTEPSRINDQIMNGLILALDKLPGGVKTTEIVELLKSPFCTGDAQQLLLKMIEAQTKLSFKRNPWMLVEQAKAAGLDPQIFRDAVRRPGDLVPINPVAK
jgi:hypothetical protein